MAKKPNYKVITKQIYDRLHFTGEEIKNDFPNKLRSAIDNEAWKHSTKIDGTEFKDVGEWLVYQFPNGCSMGHGKYSLTYEDALQLCDHPQHSDVYDLLLQNRPKKKTGPKAGTESSFDNVKETPKPPTGNSRQYIEERLQKKHPEIYREYRNGNIRSARAAGIKAGFIKDNGHDALKRLKSYWKRANKKQRQEFRNWLRTKEAKLLK